MPACYGLRCVPVTTVRVSQLCHFCRPSRLYASCLGIKCNQMAVALTKTVQVWPIMQQTDYVVHVSQCLTILTGTVLLHQSSQ